MVQSLPIHFSERLVAELLHDRGRLELRYGASAEAALSQRLPIRQAPYSDEECRAFVANLDRYQALYVNTRTGDMYRTTAPELTTP